MRVQHAALQNVEPAFGVGGPSFVWGGQQQLPACVVCDQQSTETA
jgi:hypothetical protein